MCEILDYGVYTVLWRHGMLALQSHCCGLIPPLQEWLVEGGMLGCDDQQYSHCLPMLTSHSLYCPTTSDCVHCE